MKPRYVLQILLLSAVWGISFLMIRVAGSAFPPTWVGMLRASFGALLLWLVLFIGRYKLPPRQLFPWLFLVALTNNAIPFSFFAWGERAVPSSTAAVLNATTPIWTLLLSMAVYRSRTSLHTILGVIIGFAGVAIVVYSRAATASPDAHHGDLALGIIVIALAALGYAVATVIAKAKLQGLEPIGLAVTQLTLAALMLAPVAAAGPHPADFRLVPFLAILVLGFAGSGIAYFLYYNLLAHIPATHVVAVTYLLPAWGIFWGLIAHEPIAPLAYVGVAIVIAGLILMNKSVALPPKIPAPKSVEACADSRDPSCVGSGPLSLCSEYVSEGIRLR
jgi:drug/metabolite transporter (DMT)-like permease